MVNLALDDLELAARRIAGLVRRTPLERSRWLSDELGIEVFQKLEAFQPTGSFKIRGAAAKLLSLTEEQGRRGILTASAGNHGLAVAHCAEKLEMRATIVIPESASRAKVDAIRRYPVDLIERGASYDEAERYARSVESKGDLVFVSPYNDLDVVAGQGTIGLEIIEDCSDLKTVVVPVGGGGLIAGIAAAVKRLRPDVRVVGVEPKASPTMSASLRAGRIVEIEEDRTIADGLAGNIEPESLTFPLVQRLVDDIVLVDETEIIESIARAAHEDHLMIEGAAATAIAAVRRAGFVEGPVVIIISGRNITTDLFTRCLEGSSTEF